MKQLHLFLILVFYGLHIHAQPKGAGAAEIKTGNSGTAGLNSVKVTWDDRVTVKIRIGKGQWAFKGNQQEILQLPVGSLLRVEVATPSATYSAKDSLIVVPGGGDLHLSIQNGIVAIDYQWTVDLEKQKIARANVFKELESNMVFVEGGTFTMGCTAEQGNDCLENEKPARNVTVKSFKISKYDVTQAQWKAIMGDNPSEFKGCDSCPVERVNWYDVQKFIKTLDSVSGKHFRLPKEAEWEYAARGGNKSRHYKYSGSDSINEVAWYTANSNYNPHPVGQKKPSELGLYDFSGNLWQWCSDSTDVNAHAVRGGSWYYDRGFERVSSRFMLSAEIWANGIGFRLAEE